MFTAAFVRISGSVFRECNSPISDCLDYPQMHHNFVTQLIHGRYCAGLCVVCVWTEVRVSAII